MSKEFIPQISRRRFLRRFAAFGIGCGIAAATDKLILSKPSMPEPGGNNTSTITTTPAPESNSMPVHRE